LFLLHCTQLGHRIEKQRLACPTDYYQGGAPFAGSRNLAVFRVVNGSNQERNDEYFGAIAELLLTPKSQPVAKSGWGRFPLSA